MMPPTRQPGRCMMHGMDRQIPIMMKLRVMKMVMRARVMMILTIVIMSMNVRIGQTDRGVAPRGNG